MIIKDMEKELCRAALKARENAYSPYSHFKVGAALLTSDGEIYTGCNIEISSYSPTICAERTAIFKAVSEGRRGFAAIAIAGAAEGEDPPFRSCPPCGVCRQVMTEFCDPEHFEIILAESADTFTAYTLKDLLPLGFGPDNLSC